MFKLSRVWAVNWHDHTIEVENWWTPVLWCGESLKIDGKVVDRKTGWGKISEVLEGYIPEAGSRHVVRARLGGVDAGFRAGCHILIDNKPIGGDLQKELLF